MRRNKLIAKSDLTRRSKKALLFNHLVGAAGQRQRKWSDQALPRWQSMIHSG